ncbi:DUF6090 family protein [Croceivirga thetidis]|uniref:Uncharacterized protein n=1 Tax=Croceivirga thetidis TaxID=2721623 RepID=A0ABX1GQ58_9FLAO|nr:DUF6090 family protein [Croceivirga thetidis]NKI30927.1 hypothetical protein [Croceivirga thetidis]
MIKFFRRLRQKLLSENKFSKYLLYAIGEIILVVIGILLALQVNNWNNDKNDRAKEQLYLSSFHSDMKINLKELDRVIEKSSQTISTTDSLLRYADGQIKLNTVREIQALVMETASYTFFFGAEGTIKDIFGSGDLALIQNDSIRKAMVNWEANLKYLKEFETLGKDNQLSYINYLKSETPMYKYALKRDFLDHETINKIITDEKFLNLVGEQKHMAKEVNRLYLSQKTKMTELLNQVSKTIE